MNGDTPAVTILFSVAFLIVGLLINFRGKSYEIMELEERISKIEKILFDVSCLHEDLPHFDDYNEKIK